MADCEMALRFLAFRLAEPSDYPRGDLDDFLRKAMKRLNELPEQQIERLSGDFARSMYAAAAIFGQHAFRKVFAGQTGRLPINKALFEAESVGLAKLSGHELAKLRERPRKVLAQLAELMEDGRFLQAISVGTPRASGRGRSVAGTPNSSADHSGRMGTRKVGSSESVILAGHRVRSRSAAMAADSPGRKDGT